jgi:hypothetical protein
MDDDDDDDLKSSSNNSTMEMIEQQDVIDDYDHSPECSSSMLVRDEKINKTIDSSSIGNQQKIAIEYVNNGYLIFDADGNYLHVS